MNKYGFSGGIELPQTTPERPARRKVDTESLSQAVQAGNEMGFVSREPTRRTKPGPKQREAQDKVSIPLGGFGTPVKRSKGKGISQSDIRMAAPSSPATFDRISGIRHPDYALRVCRY
jgi:hypothetical protein